MSGLQSKLISQGSNLSKNNGAPNIPIPVGATDQSNFKMNILLMVFQIYLIMDILQIINQNHLHQN